MVQPNVTSILLEDRISRIGKFEPPAWLPENCPGVIGIIDDVQEVRTFGVDHMGMLMGGQCRYPAVHI